MRVRSQSTSNAAPASRLPSIVPVALADRGLAPGQADEAAFDPADRIPADGKLTSKVGHCSNPTLPEAPEADEATARGNARPSRGRRGGPARWAWWFVWPLG